MRTRVTRQRFLLTDGIIKTTYYVEFWTIFGWEALLRYGRLATFSRREEAMEYARLLKAVTKRRLFL